VVSPSVSVLSQSISSVNAINPLVAFYNIHGRKREVGAILLFCPEHNTRRKYLFLYKYLGIIIFFNFFMFITIAMIKTPDFNLTAMSHSRLEVSLQPCQLYSNCIKTRFAVGLKP
jgi:hypothetical protein